MCKISESIKITNHAVAIYREKTIPSDAFVPQNGHCTIPSLLMRTVRLGGKSAADTEHSPCHGSKSGFGFGGISNRDRSAYSASVVPLEVRETMAHQGAGQSLFKNPEIAKLQISFIKDFGDGKDVIVFQDLDEALKENKPIEVVVFIVDATRLSALQQLAYYSKTTPGPAAIMQYGHACQQVYAIPRAEGETSDPHAIIGMTDMYARQFIDKSELSFAVPFNLYKRMVADVDECFLSKEKYMENMSKAL